MIAIQRAVSRRLAAFSVMLILAAALGRPVAAQDASLNLREAELSAFIELVAEVTGRNFIVDPRVRGTVTIIAPNTVEPDAIYRIFLNVLELNRFTVVGGEGADRIVPMQLASELPPDEARAPRGAGFVTQAIRLEHMPLNEAMEIIRPLLPSEAVLSAYPSGDLLILSDRESNVTRIEGLIRQLDRPRMTEVDVIALRNASASDVGETVAALELSFPDAKVTADERSNTLLVSGSEAFRTQVRRLVGQLDRPRNISDATVVQLGYADATKIEGVVSKLFATQAEGDAQAAGGRAAIVADVTTNSVLISAPPDLLSSIVAAVRELDQRPSQVLIEGVIFEMGADEFAELGVQFGAVINDVFAGGVQFSVGNTPTLGSLITSLLSGNVPSVGSGLSAGIAPTENNRSVAGFISALARNTTTNILSTPSILTLDNEEAEIVVARNVPFVTGRFATVGDDAIPDQPFQTIQRQDVGLTLRVTPQITADDTVRLRVEQEISNLTAAAAASGSEITQRRAIDTSILVGDGRLVLLGGLLEDQSNDTLEKVPGVGDVPILKYLFSAKAADSSKRILLLLLRPTIIRSDAEYAAVTESRYHDVRAEQASFLEDADGRYPRARRATLPPLVPRLGAPFRAGAPGAPDAPVEVADGEALMPRLPPRIDFAAD